MAPRLLLDSLNHWWAPPAAFTRSQKRKGPRAASEACF